MICWMKFKDLKEISIKNYKLLKKKKINLNNTSKTKSKNYLLNINFNLRLLKTKPDKTFKTSTISSLSRKNKLLTILPSQKWKNSVKCKENIKNLSDKKDCKKLNFNKSWTILNENSTTLKEKIKAIQSLQWVKKKQTKLLKNYKD